jgi:hypothetical protein
MDVDQLDGPTVTPCGLGEAAIPPVADYTTATGSAEGECRSHLDVARVLAFYIFVFAGIDFDFPFSTTRLYKLCDVPPLARASVVMQLPG